MIDSPDVTAIVLAGGASSRFGGDKLRVDHHGRPLLHHAILAVAEVAGHIVVVIAPDAAVLEPPPPVAPRITVARDAVAHGGPLAGLAAGIAAVSPPVRDHPPRIVLVVGGDMPGLVPAVLRLLVERLAAEQDLAAITLDASPPAPLPLAVRPDRVRAAITACLAGRRRSLRSLLEAVPSSSLPAADWRALDPFAATLSDVDTPADLEDR